MSTRLVYFGQTSSLLKFTKEYLVLCTTIDDAVTIDPFKGHTLESHLSLKCSRA